MRYIGTFDAMSEHIFYNINDDNVYYLYYNNYLCYRHKYKSPCLDSIPKRKKIEIVPTYFLPHTKVYVDYEYVHYIDTKIDEIKFEKIIENLL